MNYFKAYHSLSCEHTTKLESFQVSHKTVRYGLWYYGTVMSYDDIVGFCGFIYFFVLE